MPSSRSDYENLLLFNGTEGTFDPDDWDLGQLAIERQHRLLDLFDAGPVGATSLNTVAVAGALQAQVGQPGDLAIVGAVGSRKLLVWAATVTVGAAQGLVVSAAHNYFWVYWDTTTHLPVVVINQTGIAPNANAILIADDATNATEISAVNNNPTGRNNLTILSNAIRVLTTTAEANLSNEFNLGALASGLLKHAVSSGISTPAVAVPGTDYYNPGGTDVAVADGGTGASTAAAARTALGTAASGANGDITSLTGLTTFPVYPIAAKSAAYTLTDTDYVILANATGGAFNVTLPTAVGRTGRTFIVKKTDASANVVTVNTTSSQAIDGGTTLSLSTQYQAYTVISDGTKWHVI